MKSLDAGDTVYDCKYRYIKILQVTEETVVRMPAWVRTFLFSNWMPIFVGDWLDDIYCWFARKLGFIDLVDKSLILEDGSHCSAMSCCRPVYSVSSIEHYF